MSRFRGIDPIAVLDLQEIIFELKGSGIGVSDHRPQRARDAVRNGPGVHHYGRQDFCYGNAGRAGAQSRGSRIYLGEELLDGLRV